jgi:hypothetical protein
MQMSGRFSQTRRYLMHLGVQTGNDPGAAAAGDPDASPAHPLACAIVMFACMLRILDRHTIREILPPFADQVREGGAR